MGIQTPKVRRRSHLTIKMMTWIRTSRLSIKEAISLRPSMRILNIVKVGTSMAAPIAAVAPYTCLCLCEREACVCVIERERDVCV